MKEKILYLGGRSLGKSTFLFQHLKRLYDEGKIKIVKGIIYITKEKRTK